MIGELIRFHRRRAGLTQEQLADAAGISARSVRSIEAGRVSNPRPSTVRLLADALRLPPAERERFRSAAAARADRSRLPGEPIPGPPGAGQGPVGP